MNSDIAKVAFESLPKINTVWVTKDGNYHLHDTHGGEKFERNTEVKDEVKEEVKPVSKKKK